MIKSRFFAIMSTIFVAAGVFVTSDANAARAIGIFSTMFAACQPSLVGANYDTEAMVRLSSGGLGFVCGNQNAAQCILDSVILVGPGHTFAGMSVGETKAYKCNYTSSSVDKITGAGGEWREFSFPACRGGVSTSDPNAEVGLIVDDKLFRIDNLRQGDWDSVIDATGQVCRGAKCKSGYHAEGSRCVSDQATKPVVSATTSKCTVGGACSDAASFITAGTYNSDCVCVATACASGTYLVVKNGVSHGYCCSAAKCTGGTVLNVNSDGTTDCTCVSVAPGQPLQTITKLDETTVQVPLIGVDLATAPDTISNPLANQPLQTITKPDGTTVQVPLLGVDLATAPDTISNPLANQGQSVTTPGAVVVASIVRTPCDNGTPGYVRFEGNCITTTQRDQIVTQREQARVASMRREISDTYATLQAQVDGFGRSVWKNKDGGFNTSRLASDSIAAVVLGTAGGLITSNVIKKNQISGGFEDIQCTVGGMSVAQWGDEFRVGVQ